MALNQDMKVLVGSKKEKLDIKVALSNSFGLWGQSSSILFSPPTSYRPAKALHLLDCLRNKLLVSHRRIGNALRLNWSEHCAVRSVKELKADGIIFSIKHIYREANRLAGFYYS
ncbi:hypothetical protein FRX31_014146 [Thalictrum thalictroides]|uniref:Uncharacterized protein n=1 Tax=Thalictrum thalictroides TaxID=46969 RepID=A0A7J6WFP6_THATH|nr:hypothetical protein FRX31_014146 [Thalictrum thalictroides]